MGNRTRTDMPPEATSIPTSVTEESPFTTWATEFTLGLERVGGRLGDVEKSVDRMGHEVRDSNVVAGRAASALERIAKADEERNELLKKAEETRIAEAKKAEEARIADAKEDKKIKEEWKKRLWESQPFQLLITGLVLAMFQSLCIAYLANALPSSIGDAVKHAAVRQDVSEIESSKEGKAP